MKVDSVVRNDRLSIQQLVRALENGLTTIDNFGPEGTAGQVLTSNGPNVPPSYQSLTSILARLDAIESVLGI